MSIAIAPTTELDAVNEMLASIGEAPVNQLDNLGLQDAAVARDRLYATSRRVQSRGWSWNTDFGVSLMPDDNGTIWLPANTLKVVFTGASSRLNLTQRSNRVYDANNQTYTFVAPVTADVVTMNVWDDLPEVARQFIFITAGVRFQAGWVGSEILHKFQTEDATQAWAELLADDLEVSDWNILTDSSWAVDATNRTSVVWDLT